MIYQIQLVGGPDDGAMFEAVRLPPYWEMLKQTKSLACFLLGVDESPHVDRYWQSCEGTEDGYVLYYHEDLHSEAVSA